MIRVEKLTKIYGAFTAIDAVSFEIAAGETFALLGPNGSGKSTTLKCLAGLVHPTSGKMTINGFDVTIQSRESRKWMSFLPQRVSFQDTLTAREVLEFYGQLRKVSLSRVNAVLANPRFHFDGLSERLVSEFSGGMVQRLGLAVACLPDSPILVLDEPTINLDPEGAIRFREFLSDLKGEGKTILFSSHVLADVEQLADRIAILVGGKLIALETISGLREGLMSACKMRVVLEDPRSQWVEVVLRAGADAATLERDSVLITSNPEIRYSLLKALDSAGARVSRFMTEELSLEDIYLTYVRKLTKT